MRHNNDHKMGRKVVVIPHDPSWTEQYKQEAARLTAVFEPILLDIQHIGSTAIPGILAKPIIDIIIVVTEIAAVAPLMVAMENLDYHSKGEYGIPGRHYFYKGSAEHHTHHVHVYGASNSEIARHLDFRDFLRQHPAKARAYGQLKAQLAQQFFTDPLAYTQNKTAFIQEIESQAAQWRKKQVSS